MGYSTAYEGTLNLSKKSLKSKMETKLEKSGKVNSPTCRRGCRVSGFRGEGWWHTSVQGAMFSGYAWLSAAWIAWARSTGPRRIAQIPPIIAQPGALGDPITHTKPRHPRATHSAHRILRVRPAVPSHGGGGPHVTIRVSIRIIPPRRLLSRRRACASVLRSGVDVPSTRRGSNPSWCPPPAAEGGCDLPRGR